MADLNTDLADFFCRKLVAIIADPKCPIVRVLV